jgi:DNA-binding LytR/AlgR family response regulator
MERLAVDDRLLVPINRHFELIKVTCIEAILSAGDYSEVHLIDGVRMFMLRSLREWLARLPEKHFVRVHRSTILNVDRIDRVEEWFNWSFRIHLKSGREPIISSRRYSAELRARFR